MAQTTFSLRGYLVGPIWWPTGSECFKPLSYSITDEDARLTFPTTLRDHVLTATNDGDFQNCSIAAGELVAVRETITNGRRVTVERTWPLTCFKSIANCLHADPDWLPDYGDED